MGFLADAVTPLFAVVTRLVAVVVAAVAVGNLVVAVIVAVPYSDAVTQLDLAVVAS